MSSAASELGCLAVIAVIALVAYGAVYAAHAITQAGFVAATTACQPGGLTP